MYFLFRASTASEESEHVFPSLGAPATRKFLYSSDLREHCMIELIVILAMLTGMAKRKGRGRRSFNLRRVKVTPEIALATLASDTVDTVGLTAASTSPYRAISLKATWALSNLTAGEGPITVGLAQSDYTITEIKECLEAAGAIDVGDLPAQEKANRYVRIVGTLNSANASLNDGRPVKTKLNWKVDIGKFVNVFVYNESTGVLTTGAFINVAGDLWIKDGF